MSELGKNAVGKSQNNVGRDILFIERNLDFLKPGGRMAIVLPQGRFNNSSDKQIRDYIAERCRILAVVGLHGNVFKLHTGTKTSVLFVQKWNDDENAGPICKKVDDYNIFFATMQEPSKDNSGEKIYLKKKDFKNAKVESLVSAITEPEFLAAEPLNIYNREPTTDQDEYILDEHDHLIVKHDLFSHELKNGEFTSPGIAEAFVEFAKKEHLSFFQEALLIK